MTREITYLEAVREALRQEMQRDESVILLGEDIGVYGGAFGVTLGLLQEFGEERVIDTPISELMHCRRCNRRRAGGLAPGG